jgi:hypothetical protein
LCDMRDGTQMQFRLAHVLDVEAELVRAGKLPRRVPARR